MSQTETRQGIKRARVAISLPKQWGTKQAAQRYVDKLTARGWVADVRPVAGRSSFAVDLMGISLLGVSRPVTVSHPFDKKSTAETKAKMLRDMGWSCEVSEGSAIDMANIDREMPTTYSILINGIDNPLS